MNNENLPIEAEIVAIRATAEEASKLNKSLLAKTTIIRIQLPSGPMRMGGVWYV